MRIILIFEDESEEIPMKKFLKDKKIFKKILILGLIIYASIIFINQQTTLNSYHNEKEYLSLKIEEKKEDNETLISTKNNVNSSDYIEEMAREKLDMYLPNERVYIDM